MVCRWLSMHDCRSLTKKKTFSIIQKFQMGLVGKISSDEALEVILGGIRLTYDMHFVLLLE